MSTAPSKYGFLPWSRIGLANEIIQTDSGFVGTNERTSLKVDVTAIGPGNSQVVTRHVDLTGPGDILGINANAFVRSEPRDGVFDFEANCLPYIEFYEEDFPWRYTPAKHNNQKLRPWLALIVLKDDEFDWLPATENLPPAIRITASLSDILHPYDQHWAWAHVHINQPNSTPVGSLTTEQAYLYNLKNDLKANPDVAVSRLLCSRRLEPSTQYTAFLIPAFETGRKAGLGEDTTSVPSLKSSWDTAVTDFPFYKQWRFGTAVLGDFETLARALQPKILSSSMGGRTMDISASGMGLDTLFTAVGSGPPLITETTVQMEGALMPPQYTQAPAQNISSPAADNGSINSTSNDLKDFTSALLDILNLASNMQGDVYAAVAPGLDNPYIISTNLDVDPVVVPYLYGQWHANVKRLQAGSSTPTQPASPMWLQQLNLDTRYRAAAGLGTSVVKEKQEKLMEIAWRQIGEVKIVNDKIAKAKMALEASRYVYQKHFIGKNYLPDLATTTASTSDIEAALNKSVRLGSQAFKKIKINIPAITINNIVAKTAKTGAVISNMTKATIDSGFRKITRNRSVVVQKMSTTTSVNNNLATQIDKQVVAAASRVISSPPGAVSLSGTSSLFSASSSATYGSSMVQIADWAKIYYNQYLLFSDAIKYYIQQEAKYNPNLLQISTTAGQSYVNHIQAALDPELVITERVTSMLYRQVNSNFVSLTDLNPIMAYPVIDQPVYDDLLKISQEYIVPNVGEIQNNTVTLMETNNRFIEAFMAGLNHEFARELLWREYPTDQRGSYFRRFWDILDTVDLTSNNPANVNYDYLFDIKPMHQWQGALGSNHMPGRHNSNSARIVLLIRGDLLKKYPNTLIYAQKAHGGSVPRTLEPEALVNGKPDPDIFQFPIFKAMLQPDIVVLGFELTASQVHGTIGNSSDPGWFFVFRERPGQLRFGMDEPPIPGTLTSWDDLNWGHMRDISSQLYKTVRIDAAPLMPASTPITLNGITWGAHAANMAYILYQSPSMVAIHGDDMIL